MRTPHFVIASLSLSLALTACGLKGDLYLSSPANSPAPAPKAQTSKGGDDNKAAQNKTPSENKQ